MATASSGFTPHKRRWHGRAQLILALTTEEADALHAVQQAQGYA